MNMGCAGPDDPHHWLWLRRRPRTRANGNSFEHLHTVTHPTPFSSSWTPGRSCHSFWTPSTRGTRPRSAVQPSGITAEAIAAAALAAVSGPILRNWPKTTLRVARCRSAKNADKRKMPSMFVEAKSAMPITIVERGALNIVVAQHDRRGGECAAAAPRATLRTVSLASRPTAFFLANPTVPTTSSIGRFGCCWLGTPGFGSCQGQF